MRDEHVDIGIVFALGRYKRQWSSRFAHTLVDFYFKEWKWIWGVLVAVLLAFAKLH